MTVRERENEASGKQGSEEERMVVRTLVGGEAVLLGPGSQGRGQKGQYSPRSVSAGALQPTPLPFPGKCPSSSLPDPCPDSNAQTKDLHYSRCPQRDCTSLPIL